MCPSTISGKNSFEENKIERKALHFYSKGRFAKLTKNSSVWNWLSFVFSLACENSRQLATLPLVSPPNDFWETNAEIPYWWRVTTQIWVVLLDAIHSTKISRNFGPKLNGSVRSNLKSFEKPGPPFEVLLFSRSDRSEFWLNGSCPLIGRATWEIWLNQLNQNCQWAEASFHILYFRWRKRCRGDFRRRYFGRGKFKYWSHTYIP